MGRTSIATPPRAQPQQPLGFRDLTGNFRTLLGSPNRTEDEELNAALAASLEEARQQEEQRAREEREEWARLDALAEVRAAIEREMAVAATADAGADSAVKEAEFEPKSTVTAVCSPPLMNWKGENCGLHVGGGLQNLGNSCFMNATLQCLAYVPPMTQMLADGHHKTCESNDFCVLCECTRLFPPLIRSQNGVFRPYRIFNNLSKMNDLLRPGQQEDAHEFLSSLLSRMEDDEAKSDCSNNKMSSLFRGMTRTTTRCGHCLSKSYREEPFLCLSLDVAGSLNESLTLFSTSELLRGNDSYFCDNCNSKKIASKTLLLSSLPPVLVIHLKRFRMSALMDGWTKSDVSESFPLEFQVDDDFVVDREDKEKEKAEYECVSVLVHAGATLGCGHYYADVKGMDGFWYRMNDERVTRIRTKDVQAEQAYILVYKRKFVDPLAAMDQDDSCQETDPVIRVEESVESESESENLSDDDEKLPARIVCDDFYSGNPEDFDESDRRLLESFESVPRFDWFDCDDDMPWVEGRWVF